VGEGGSEGEGSRRDSVFVVVVVRACVLHTWGNELIELVELKKKLVKSIQSL
jgi:hypothetical protein